jgi:hypothetical protein
MTPRKRKRYSDSPQVLLFTNFQKLSIGDLKKLVIAKSKYDTNYHQYLNDSSETYSHNKNLKDARAKDSATYNEWWIKKIKPREDRIRWLTADIQTHTVGIVGTIFGDNYIEFGGRRLKNTPEVRQKISDLDYHKRELAQCLKDPPTPQAPCGVEFKQEPNKPVREQRFSFGGVFCRVDLGSLEVEVVTKLISQRESELRLEKESIKELRARVTKSEQETRNQAKQYQSLFDQQRRIVSSCPYCGGSLNSSDSHLDHIYPVSKGGQSVRRNLVYVCSVCNLKKKNQTLRAFVLSVGLSESLVYERLEKLQKEF